MPHLPSLSGKEVVRALGKIGYQEIRQRVAIFAYLVHIKNLLPCLTIKY